jgi:outer membrane receptor protein involved in Fe transport
VQNQKRDFAPTPPYSIGNPKPVPGDYRPGSQVHAVLDSTAFFAINTLTFWADRAHLVTGYRNEEAKIYNKRVSRTDSTDTREPTTQVGLAFDLTPSVTLFANSSSSFLPTASVDINGKTLPPEVGEGIDVGLKFAAPQRGLSGTISYFDLERANISRFVQINLPDGTIVLTNVPSGTERSRGIDLELGYSPNAKFDLIASATFLDGKIVSDQRDPRNNGRPIPHASDSSFSLWGKYRFAEHWTFALGYSYKSEQKNIDPQFARRLWNVPEFQQLDALLERRLRVFSQDLVVSLSVTNLANRRGTVNRFEHQDPRWIKLGVKSRF